MHGPEELLASCMMLLVAYPELLAIETLQSSISTFIAIVPTVSANTHRPKPIYKRVYRSSKTVFPC